MVTVEQVMQKLIGIKFKDAQSILWQFGYKIRVVKCDGKDMVIDDTVDENRVNVSVTDMGIDKVYGMK